MSRICRTKIDILQPVCHSERSEESLRYSLESRRKNEILRPGRGGTQNDNENKKAHLGNSALTPDANNGGMHLTSRDLKAEGGAVAMTKAEELKRVLGLPPVSQLGVVVREVGIAVERYSSIFGIGPFTVYEFTPEKHWLREKPSHVRVKQGKAMWGPIELELIQTLEGESLFSEFLRIHGEGIHHLGFNTPNYDEMFQKFREAGFAPLARAESYVETYKGYLRACQFDTYGVCGISFEIIWKSWLMES